MSNRPLHFILFAGTTFYNMTLSLFSGLFIFCLVTSITPGPNNLMLLAAGANFGVRRTLPHAAGVVIGFTLMIIIIGLGAAQIFQKFPVAHTVLTGASIAYLLYLAFKIATSAPKNTHNRTSGTPITFFQAVMFQWVNPKAWTMALAAITVYTPQPTTNFHVVIVSLIFGAINLPSISVWLVLGVQMRRFLTTDKRFRAFNWTMSILLVLSLYPILNLQQIM